MEQCGADRWESSRIVQLGINSKAVWDQREKDYSEWVRLEETSEGKLEASEKEIGSKRLI